MAIVEFQNRNQVPVRGCVNDSIEETNALVNIELKTKIVSIHCFFGGLGISIIQRASESKKSKGGKRAFFFPVK